MFSSSNTKSAIHHDRAAYANRSMRANRFDAVTALLMSLILFLSVFVIGLGVTWMIQPTLAPSLIQSPPITLTTWTRESKTEPEFEEPSAVETEYLTEPTLENTVDALSLVKLPESDAALANEPTNSASCSGCGYTLAESSPPGIGIVPRHERWQLNFVSKSEKQYAQLLDELGIELGVFGGGHDGIDYASRLAKTPVMRTNRNPTTERRLYFSWNVVSTASRPLVRYERNLLSKAGIVTKGRNLVKFIPAKLEDQLSKIELEYAAHKGHDSVLAIEKTVFEIGPNNTDDDLKVKVQRYRQL